MTAPVSTERTAGTPLRVASKSVWSRTLIDRVVDRPGWHGVLAFTLPEALWPADGDGRTSSSHIRP